MPLSRPSTFARNNETPRRAFDAAHDSAWTLAGSQGERGGLAEAGLDPISQIRNHEPLAAEMDDTESELSVATRHIAIAKDIVARQRIWIGRLAAARRPTEEAQKTLDIFVDTLTALEARRSFLQGEEEKQRRQARVVLFPLGRARLRNVANFDQASPAPASGSPARP
jgi:hypothetical protein